MGRLIRTLVLVLAITVTSDFLPLGFYNAPIADAEIASPEAQSYIMPEANADLDAAAAEEVDRQQALQSMIDNPVVAETEDTMPQVTTPAVEMPVGAGASSSWASLYVTSNFVDNNPATVQIGNTKYVGTFNSGLMGGVSVTIGGADVKVLMDEEDLNKDGIVQANEWFIRGYLSFTKDTQGNIRSSIIHSFKDSKVEGSTYWSKRSEPDASVTVTENTIHYIYSAGAKTGELWTNTNTTNFGIPTEKSVSSAGYWRWESAQDYDKKTEAKAIYVTAENLSRSISALYLGIGTISTLFDSGIGIINRYAYTVKETYALGDNRNRENPTFSIESAKDNNGGFVAKRVDILSDYGEFKKDAIYIVQGTADVLGGGLTNDTLFKKTTVTVGGYTYDVDFNPVYEFVHNPSFGVQFMGYGLYFNDGSGWPGFFSSKDRILVNYPANNNVTLENGKTYPVVLLKDGTVNLLLGDPFYRQDFPDNDGVRFGISIWHGTAGDYAKVVWKYEGQDVILTGVLEEAPSSGCTTKRTLTLNTTGTVYEGQTWTLEFLVNSGALLSFKREGATTVSDVLNQVSYFYRSATQGKDILYSVTKEFATTVINPDKTTTTRKTYKTEAYFKELATAPLGITRTYTMYHQYVNGSFTPKMYKKYTPNMPSVTYIVDGNPDINMPNGNLTGDAKKDILFVQNSAPMGGPVGYTVNYGPIHANGSEWDFDATMNRSDYSGFGLSFTKQNANGTKEIEVIDYPTAQSVTLENTIYKVFVYDDGKVLLALPSYLPLSNFYTKVYGDYDKKESIAVQFKADGSVDYVQWAVGGIILKKYTGLNIYVSPDVPGALGIFIQDPVTRKTMVNLVLYRTSPAYPYSVTRWMVDDTRMSASYHYVYDYPVSRILNTKIVYRNGNVDMTYFNGVQSNGQYLGKAAATKRDGVVTANYVLKSANPNLDSVLSYTETKVEVKADAAFMNNFLYQEDGKTFYFGKGLIDSASLAINAQVITQSNYSRSTYSDPYIRQYSVESIKLDGVKKDKKSIRRISNIFGTYSDMTYIVRGTKADVLSLSVESDDILVGPSGVANVSVKYERVGTSQVYELRFNYTDPLSRQVTTIVVNAATFLTNLSNGRTTLIIINGVTYKLAPNLLKGVYSLYLTLQPAVLT